MSFALYKSTKMKYCGFALVSKPEPRKELWIFLKYNPVPKVAVFGFMNPVFGVILSAIFLKEGSVLGFVRILSLVLTAAGIFIVNQQKEK